VSLFRRAPARGAEIERLEERRQTLSRATQDWLSLLHEMEANGETSDPRYQRYFSAYVEAREQEKRADLELFNVRRGLVSR
jgi:hypothetical protein